MQEKLSILQTTRFTLKNLFDNKTMYVRNAAFLQFFISTIGFWILSMLFKGALTLSGESNLNFSNFKVVFTSPLSILAMIVYIFALALFIFIEFSILTFMIYGTIRGTHISWRSSIQNAFGELRQFFSPQIIYFLLYFITLLPIAGLGVNSGLFEQLYIPNFITGEIMKTTNGALLYSVAIVGLSWLHLRFIYALPLQILTNDSFSINLKNSWKLTRKRLWRLVAIFALVELTIGLITLLVTGILSFAVVFLTALTENEIAITIFLTIIKLAIFFLGIYTKLSLLVVLIKIASDEHYVSEEITGHKSEIPFKNLVITLLAFLGLTADYSIEAYTQYKAQVSPSQAIVGHRGFVEYGVENSIESLEAAAKAGVDYVELDILLTKDNRFIVMHDYNLKRLAQINKRVQDMTYDELVGLPIYQDGFTSHIPSFEEFVAKAKELNVKLLVELKPHGGEPDNYVDLFIEKMHELKIDTAYKVMSLDLKVMEEIEQKAPEMDTGYVIPIQFGGFGNPKVDFYVIEDFSYNDLAVVKAQEEGHEVYVWTINEPEQLNKYLRSSVNGIITDIPDVARQEETTIKEQNTPIDQVLNAIGFN